MKILIVTDAWEPQVNGVVTTYKNLIKGLEKDGYEVEVISPNNFKHQVYTKKYPEVPITLPFGIINMINDANADYIHVATEGPIGLAASLYLRYKKMQFTTSYHTHWVPFLEQIVGLPAWLTKIYLRWFHRDKKVFCPSESVKGYLSNTRIGGKQVVWSRGVDEEVFNAVRTKKNDGIKTLLYVGRVSKEKNLNEFLNLSFINKDDGSPLYRCVVVGDGPYLQKLKTVYNKVEFRGYKSGKELVNEYLNADVFVFPSRVDTFGLVMIEAMYCGTPVAAFPVTGPSDVVDYGITGYVHTNLKIAVSSALNLDREKVAQFARSKWSWKNTVDCFVREVENV